ncbi:MAG: isoprenylcysteine carboxylmethyltransferase family protein [Phenylobacterium sp.]|uniref:methanethiol S-methyltransferase n=1 Tax=Phenylobacterium sp. TaxID=1871053 RepID=UPI001A5219A3|nr:methanethiol S-methyltransferase [Phenylobacterium sp.]MBL8552721.1 isoprenylcysteine carboxylmethyltransferase family protein [Phenylobacterium sp.]
MTGLLFTLYGVVAYLVFFATFLYAIAFVGDLPVPRTIDSGLPGPLVPSLLIDAALLGLFAVQHSVMARPAFKRVWTRIVPKPIERSTYVLFASLALIVMFVFWRPLPQLVWEAPAGLAATALAVLFWAGWGVVLVSTFLISHFELFGLQQVWNRLRGRPPAPIAFRTPGFYRGVRHPIYLGFIVAFWATPAMSLGHLVFAVATLGYILIAIQFEERDLIAVFGDRYRAYRAQVGMLIPKLGARGKPERAA